ncbi:MAG: proton-conducting transporter membrane subunit [Candidatus Micrarchaeota archaeon]
MMLLISAVLFLAGAAFAYSSQKFRFFAKAAGLLCALLASGALTAAGLLGVLGSEASPLILAPLGPLGAFSFSVDGLSGFFAIIIGLVGMAVSIYSYPYLTEYERKGYNPARFCILFNLFLLSMALVVTAQNGIAFLVFWEIMAVSSFFLVTYEHKEPASQSSGFIYLLMTHFGTACLIVMFLALASGAGGSFDFAAFAHASYAPAMASAIFILALVGFGMKAGLMPFHVWLPIAHPNAPSNISALMSGVMLKTAIYALVRVIFGFLLASQPVPPLWWGLLILAIGAVSSVMGVLYSLMEHDIKVLLAYHSIENIGIILLGLGGAVTFASAGLSALAALSLFAALYHTLNHALFKSLLFLGAGSVVYSTHTRNIDELGGIAKSMPLVALLFFIGAASIAAIPPLNGFVSEWLTFTSLLGGVGSSDLVSFAVSAAVLFLALTSAFAVAAFVKAFGITFLGAPRSEHAHLAREAPTGMLAGMAILALACIAAGIFPGSIAALAFPALSQLGMSGASGIFASVERLPTFAIFVALLASSLLVLAVLHLLKGRFKAAQAVGPTWDCGIPAVDGHMQYSAKGFTMPIIRSFSSAVNPLGTAQSYGSRFFTSVLYEPLQNIFLTVSPWSRKLQSGNLMHYIMYLIITLVAVLAYALMG